MIIVTVSIQCPILIDEIQYASPWAGCTTKNKVSEMWNHRYYILRNMDWKRNSTMR